VNKNVAVLIVCFATTGSMALPALAEVEYVSQQNVHRSVDRHRLARPFKRRIYVDAPAAQHAVSVASRDTVYYAGTPKRFRVLVVNTPIVVEADTDYLHQGEFRIDQDHHIPAAQRLYRSLTAKPARIVRNNRSRTDRPTTASIQPRMIFLKSGPGPHNPNARPNKKGPIPTVPAPPRQNKRERLMASAQ